MNNTWKKALAFTVCLLMIAPGFASCKIGKAITEETGDFDAVTTIDKVLEQEVPYTGDPIVHVETVITHIRKEVTDNSGSGNNNESGNSNGNNNEGSGNNNGNNNNNGGGTENNTANVDTTGTPLKILTQNLLVSNTITENVSDQRISFRQYRLKKMVETLDPDVIGFQEANEPWVNCLPALFSDKYVIKYKYRAENVSGGKESTPVLYKKSKFDLVDEGHFWLSSTPNVQSISWGENNGVPARICSWVKLKFKTTGETFYFYSTHFPLGGEPAAKAGGQLADTFSKLPKNTYAFCVGDFNVNRNTTSELYLNIFNNYTSFVDLWDVAEQMKKSDWNTEVFYKGGTMNENDLGEAFDYENYGGDKGGNARKFFDYVCAKPQKHLGINYIKAIYDLWGDDSRQVSEGFISDHFGVICEVRLGSAIDFSKGENEFYTVNY